MASSGYATCFLVLAVILGPITLVFMAVSFGTDHWLEFDVNKDGWSDDLLTDSKSDPSKALYYNSRIRGLFHECYTDYIEFLTHPQLKDKVVDDSCFYVKYNMPDNTVSVSDNYKIRIHLNRCFLAFFILALALFLVAYILGLVLCCSRRSRWAYLAGILSFSSAFSVAAAIAFFHGAEYIERNKLDEEPFYSYWPEEVKDSTDRDYGWSYALGWVSMILAALAGIFYSVLGYLIAEERYEDRDEKHSLQPRPMGMEPVYAVGADAYYNKAYGYPQRAYLGPMAPEYYTRYPTMGYGESSKDMWHWREVES